MIYKNLLTEVREHALIITFNREKKLNALNQETLTELDAALKDAFENEFIRGIILTGAGDKAFMAGADITEFLHFNELSAEEIIEKQASHIFDKIEQAPKPVIAAINGYALGGGTELALACHIRLAATTAKMGLPEVSLGLIPGYGGTQRLTKLVGKGASFEMILTGNQVNAEQALQMGLVNYVVAPDDLLVKAQELIAAIATRSSSAVRSAIIAINAASDDQTDGVSVELREFAQCAKRADFKEGVSAFLEKRKPNF